MPGESKRSPFKHVACNKKARYHAFHVTLRIESIHENKYIGASAKASHSFT